MSLLLIVYQELLRALASFTQAWATAPSPCGRWMTKAQWTTWRMWPCFAATGSPSCVWRRPATCSSAARPTRPSVCGGVPITSAASTTSTLILRTNYMGSRATNALMSWKATRGQWNVWRLHSTPCSGLLPTAGVWTNPSACGRPLLMRTKKRVTWIHPLPCRRGRMSLWLRWWRAP